MRGGLGKKMKKAAVSLLLVVCSLALFAAGMLAVRPEPERKVVFVDLDAVVSGERKRIFSEAVRGELSREGAEEKVGRFFLRFGDVLGSYEAEGYLVLEAGAVLSGGRDATAEMLEKLSSVEDGR